MLERSLVGLLVFVLVGPAVGGLVIGLEAFLSKPGWDSAGLLALFPVFAYFFGVLPAAATGAIAGALHPSRAQETGHFIAISVLGAALSAVAAYAWGEGNEGRFALCGLVASVVCERLRRRFHASHFATVS